MTPKPCPKCGKTSRNNAGMAIHIKNCGIDEGARFWSYVEKGDGCWLWTGAKHRDGYGRFNAGPVGRKRIKIAHRFAWMLANGPIPAGKHVAHSCDVRACCNPAHLFLATHQQNMADCKAKGRNLKGEMQPHATLTDAQALEIRMLFKRTGPRKCNAKELAVAFGVRIDVVYAIGRGKAWKHVRLDDIDGAR